MSEGVSSAAKPPVLSLVLCSRNDAYMGNSVWRLETTLNYTCDRVQALGREDDVEIIVADWGSEIPLAEVVRLRPAAARIVSFLHVPPALARSLQQDSPFPEVLALNAAARRARGQYIGRIDQDTLVGERFLRWMVDAAPTGQTTLFFANRRSIPYRLAVLCPRLSTVERFIAWFGDRLRIETGRVFYNIDVGVWLLHRDLWRECGGYDERMIYMNDMEIDMVTRLMTKYPMVDLGKRTGYDFYHLDHYHPGRSRSSSTHRTVNSQRALPAIGFQPNGDGWGLAAYPLECARSTRGGANLPTRNGADRPTRNGADRPTTSGADLVGPRWLDLPIFAMLSLYTAVHTSVDRLIYPFYPAWTRRAAIAWATVRGKSVTQWPSLLKRLWLERPSARRGEA